jgi:hypothetical protein
MLMRASDGGAAGLAHGLATAGLLEHDLLVEPLPVDEGWMGIPDRPASGAVAGGLGVELNTNAVTRFTAELIEGVEPDEQEPAE